MVNISPTLPWQRGRLTPCGKMQAKLTARTLMSTCMSDKPPIEKIIPSTMVRAQQTANIVHDHPKFVGIPLEDKDLQEGSPERAHTVERFEQMFKKYFVPAGQTSIMNVIVRHANVIRFFVCRSLGIDRAKWCKMAIPHCRTAITIRPSYEFCKQFHPFT